MRSISLLPYKVADGQDYQVRKSLAFMMFVPALPLNARDTIEHDRIARKIETTAGDTLLLEDAEWQRLKKSTEAHTGFSRSDVELISRILNAPEVPVKQDLEEQ